MNWLQQMTGIT